MRFETNRTDWQSKRLGNSLPGDVMLIHNILVPLESVVPALSSLMILNCNPHACAFSAKSPVNGGGGSG